MFYFNRVSKNGNHRRNPFDKVWVRERAKKTSTTEMNEKKIDNVDFFHAQAHSHTYHTWYANTSSTRIVHSCRVKLN